MSKNQYLSSTQGLNRQLRVLYKYAANLEAASVQENFSNDAKAAYTKMQCLKGDAAERTDAQNGCDRTS